MPDETSRSLFPGELTTMPTDQKGYLELVREAGINPMHMHWSRFIVAQGLETVIGCGQLRPHRDGSYELASLAIAPSSQGRGIGKAIVYTLIELCPADVYLMCDAKMWTFYESFGFRVVGARDLPNEMSNMFRLGRAFAWLARTLARQPVWILGLRRAASC